MRCRRDHRWWSLRKIYTQKRRWNKCHCYHHYYLSPLPHLWFSISLKDHTKALQDVKQQAITISLTPVTNHSLWTKERFQWQSRSFTSDWYYQGMCFLDGRGGYFLWLLYNYLLLPCVLCVWVNSWKVLQRKSTSYDFQMSMTHQAKLWIQTILNLNSFPHNDLGQGHDLLLGLFLYEFSNFPWI